LQTLISTGKFDSGIREALSMRIPASLNKICFGFLRTVALNLLVILSACTISGPQQKLATDHVEVGELSSESTGTLNSRTDVAVSRIDALDGLWQARMAESAADMSSPEFVLGPGDVLSISIPQIPQLAHRRERVSEQNTITLPLLGEINVAGMTQEELLHTLSQRTKKFVYHPQVDVFIQHTENRQVAVVGAVKTPGRYALASKADTIMTMIDRAGGMTENAGSSIILVPGVSPSDVKLAAADFRSAHSGVSSPGSHNTRPEATQIAYPAGGYQSLDGAADSAALFSHILRQRVVINTTRAEDQRYLDLPAKPGDVIIVPAAGQVTVQGWVEKPGAFPITPGMTVLGSIAAAGGPDFSHNATLLREEDDGREIDVSLDLNKLKSGEERDVHVQSGDIVVVERSVAGAVPYALYECFQKIGGYLPLAPAF
jgi:polysaccharide export outer membrane protein